MSNAATIAQIYKHEERTFLKCLDASARLREESIHKLRVKIKHLASLFSFLEFLTEKGFKRKEAMSMLAPVFKRAGKIRSATLHLRLLGAYRSRGMMAVKAELKHKESRAKKNFLTEVSGFDEKKFEKLHQLCLKQFKKQDSPVVIKKSRRYVDALMSGIRTDMAGLRNDEALHDIRKKLKHIKTIAALLEDLLPGTSAAEAYKKISVLEEPIGKWHDTVSLMGELEKFIATHREDMRANAQLTAFVLKLNAGKEAYKKQIAKKLRVLLK